MDYIEDYFKNLLFNGKDPIKLFGNMGELFSFLESKEVEDDWI